MTPPSSPPPRIVALGEGLIRLQPPGHERLEAAHQLDISVGGSELNTLVLLARLGLRTSFVTRLPDGPLGQLVAIYARGHCVELDLGWDPAARMGVYFVERGASPRGSVVHYDRVGSALSRMDPDETDWETVLDDAACFHTTGITLAVGDGCRTAALRGLQTARSRDVITSFDVNHRAALWSAEEARRAVETALPFVDVLFASQFDLCDLLRAGDDPIVAGRQLRERYGIKLIVIPERRAEDGAAHTIAVTAVGDDVSHSTPVRAQVVDSVGIGDAVSGAFLAYWLRGYKLELAIERAAVAGGLKSTVVGDALAATVDELGGELNYAHRVTR